MATFDEDIEQRTRSLRLQLAEIEEQYERERIHRISIALNRAMRREVEIIRAEAQEKEKVLRDKTDALLQEYVENLEYNRRK